MILEEVTINPTEDESSARDSLGRLTGEVIKTVQQSIKQGFLDWSPRLLLAMYSCEIQASSKSFSSPPKSILIYHSRSPRTRLRRPNPTSRPHSLRIPQRRNPLLHHPLTPSCRRILRFLRRDPQTHIWCCFPATHIPRLRDPR